jgi:hypothetical protein
LTSTSHNQLFFALGVFTPPSRLIDFMQSVLRNKHGRRASNFGHKRPGRVRGEIHAPFPPIFHTPKVVFESTQACSPGPIRSHCFRIAVIRNQTAPSTNQASAGKSCRYCNFAYSASACFRIGISGSASFQSFRKSSYADFARVRSPDIEYARASCRKASAPMGSLTTIPR